MTYGRLAGWLLLALLLQSAPAFGVVTVTTDSLHLQFNQRGDLMRAEACFPRCAEKQSKKRLLSSAGGMLVFEPSANQDLQLERQDTGASTELSFSDAAGQLVRRWRIPDHGWLISVSAPQARKAVLMSGPDFRPAPSSGFGYLLEQTRYLVFDDTDVQTVSLDEVEPMSLTSNGWVGFRNRFWTAVALSEVPLSITPLTGESIEDARVEMGSGQGFEMDLYFGPVEPVALSQAAVELESLMYSSLWFWLRWICQALYFLLSGIAMVVPQWGLAVMVLSVLVGILMKPLSRIADRLQDQVHETDARLAPELAAIKKQYKGEEQSEKIIAMYKNAGVHPLYSLKSLAGVFVVIPVFIGAFDMLAENIHLSGESFLWIADLSHPDAFLQLPFSLPFFGGYLNLLPFIMTGFSYVASKLHSHPAMDAATRRKHSRNLVLMALGFLVLFYTFPAGMVLYWTTNNLISVIKTLWKRRKLRTV